MEQAKLYHIDTKTEFVVRTPEFTSPVEYPFTWFTNNKTKPLFKISVMADCSLETARVAAFEFLMGEKIPPSHVIDYLYEFCKTMTQELDTNWDSYGQIIGKKGDTVTPINLLHVMISQDTRKYTPKNPRLLTDEVDIYLVGNLLCSYRYNKTHEKMQTAYGTKVASILAPFSTHDTQNIRIATFLTNSKSLVDHPNFEIMASAIDMFLERFPSHGMGKLRFGTIGLRYQGCSGLVDLTYLKQILKKSGLADAIKWLFAGCLVSEVFQMMINHQDEIDVKHSYFPYMIGFKISNKSPFSAGSNPSVHTLVHLIGSLLGSPRSINAIMIEYGVISDIVVNAAIVFFAHRSDIGAKVRFGEKGVMDEIHREEDMARQRKRSATAGGLPATQPTDPRGWLAEYQDRDYKFTQSEVDDLNKVIQGIPQVRAGTVGEWVKLNFISNLPKGFDVTRV